MTDSTHTTLAEIVKIEKTDKGYTKLLLLVNIPYKTNYIPFNLWPKKVERFLTGDDKKNVGDYVQAKYHYKGNFTELDELEKMECFDNCPLCWCNLEATDAQRIDCPGCALMGEEEKKERVAESMVLKSKEFNVYLYSSGYKLIFLSEEGSEFVFVVFKKSPLYDEINELVVSKKYQVVGWKNKGDFKIHPLDIVNIYKN